LAKLLYSDH
jgi:hypothetical protein